MTRRSLLLDGIAILLAIYVLLRPNSLYSDTIIHCIVMVHYAAMLLRYKVQIQCAHPFMGLNEWEREEEDAGVSTGVFTYFQKGAFVFVLLTITSFVVVSFNMSLKGVYVLLGMTFVLKVIGDIGVIYSKPKW